MALFGTADPGQPGLGLGFIATIVFWVIKLVSWLYRG